MFSLPKIRKRIFVPLLSTLFLLISIWTGVILVQRQQELHKKAQAQEVIEITYQESSEDFANPERGFMRQSNIWVDKPLDPSKISAKDSSDSVVWIYFHLENYRDPRDGPGVTLTNYQGKSLEPIGSGKGLDTVNNAFIEARRKGLKLVIRFLYIGYSGIGSNSNPATAQPDAPLSLVQQHVNQLTPLFQQNKDVIAAVQIGFVGYWGEWHSSKYLGDLPTRRAVIDAVLAAVPKDRMLQLRYPRYKQLFYGGPLTDAQAFNQSDLARIGLHDDAFLRDDTDGGTFTSRTAGTKITNYCDGFSGGETACWRDYVNRDTRYLPVGGEAGTHSSTPSQYADCSNALLQLSNMHWSFIHNGYSRVTLDHWVNQGCMPEIRRRLGYRFVLSRLNVSRQVAPGGTMTFRLELRNEGFASPYNPRPVILVLKEKTTGNQREIPLTSVDPRRWLPGQSISIDLQIQIPANLPQGTYNLYLWLPDAAQSIRARPEYAIRLANQNVGQAGTGFNLLFDNLIVSGSLVTITPPPTLTPTPTKSPTATPTPTKPPTPTPTKPPSPTVTPTKASTATPTPTTKPTSTLTPTPPPLLGDINKDGVVNILDFQLLNNAFGTTDSASDLNKDGIVNILDFQILSNNFGKTGG